MVLPAQAQQTLERLEDTRERYYNLSSSAAELLFTLARIVRPREVVEVGTSNGYSAMILGSAVRPVHGRVWTIERDGARAAEAKQNIAEGGLEDTVTVIPGSAYKVLKRLAGPFDFVFLDGTKQEYGGYFERVRDKLAPGAVLVADNLLSHAAELQEFRSVVERDPAFTTVVVPVGTGLLIAVHAPDEGPVASPIPAHIGSLVLSTVQRVSHRTGIRHERQA